MTLPRFSDFSMFQPMLLWSDILIFILLFSLIAFFINLSRNPVARARWRHVFTTRIGSGAFIVIVFYVLIAVLDSLHFRTALPPVEGGDGAVAQEADGTVHYSQDVRSVLDIILHDLDSQDEKTYSAPFALYSFAKENQESDAGYVIRAFPRLEHGGKHIVRDEEHVLDIWVKTARAIGLTILPCLLVIFLHSAWRRRKPPVEHPLPWSVIYTTLTILVLLCGWVLNLSQYYHILGTDKVGQDVLYQSIKAIRTGVLIGTLATLVTLPLAVVLGISAGYFKGKIDDVVQYIYTTLNSIPGILLIAASVLLIDVYIETNPEQFKLISERADFKFIALCFILGVTSWTGLCRLLRAETLKLSQLEYVQAAHAFGVGNWRIIFRHILPNVNHIILIALVLDFSAFVLAEAVLSYIGVGVDPSMASWGNMINEARSELARDPVVWWSVSAAFILMFVLVLAANLFSDRVRDAFDPRSAHGRV
ncbi:ABC transporter permease [Thalassolituus oleivorans]|uniref:ABC transporter permease n=1 Tax=Thalassolituus oleivorans TaxID=187493 RepID=UPI0023F7DD78|nr:ABC transporter permease [Thalassolituus oleivorans]